MAEYDGPEQVVIGVGDTKYIFRPGEITPKISRKVRSETGMGLLQALTMLGSEPDIDILAAICFAAALQTDFNKADLADIDEAFNYTTDVTLDVTNEEDEDPEV